MHPYTLDCGDAHLHLSGNPFAAPVLDLLPNNIPNLAIVLLLCYDFSPRMIGYIKSRLSGLNSFQKPMLDFRGSEKICIQKDLAGVSIDGTGLKK
jgi:hypothetical protein